MADCPEAGVWSHTGPTESGYYEVRPCSKAWNFGPESPFTPPVSRITHVDVISGRFDATAFGGQISDPLWEWRGPVRVPASLPDVW